jgi:hypothetical protein
VSIADHSWLCEGRTIAALAAAAAAAAAECAVLLLLMDVRTSQKECFRGNDPTKCNTKIIQIFVEIRVDVHHLVDWIRLSFDR